MIPVTDIRARESFCFMRWSKSSWGFFRWFSCSLSFISYRPFHSPCSCISRSPGSEERACGASPWQRWPPCWCPALPLGQDAALQQQLAGQVASEEENGVQHALNIKMGKYSERCEAEGTVFIPQVVDRFGGWHKVSLEVITKLGRHTEKKEEEIMRQLKYLEGCLGETRRRSTEPRLTLVSFKICSKLSLNTLDNHFIPFLTGQQSSQLRSMPKNCAFYTHDGNLR